MSKRVHGSKRVNRLRRQAKPKNGHVIGAKTRALGYVRVSTGGQFADGHGMDVQENSIRSFATSQGYELVNVIPDCASGAQAPIERDGFRQVVDLAKQSAFDVLLLYKFDRLARSVLFAVTTVHMLRDEYGVVVRSVTEPIDTATPMGEMIFSVLASMAAQERHTITERTYGGRREKARRGGVAGGRTPYGYRRNPDGGIVIEPTQAEIVKRIFKARDGGSTYQQITDVLNAENVPSPSGGKWALKRVAYILDNPKYRGLIEYFFSWDGPGSHILQKGAHDAIIA